MNEEEKNTPGIIRKPVWLGSYFLYLALPAHGISKVLIFQRLVQVPNKLSSHSAGRLSERTWDDAISEKADKTATRYKHGVQNQVTRKNIGQKVNKSINSENPNKRRR